MFEKFVRHRKTQRIDSDVRYESYLKRSTLELSSGRNVSGTTMSTCTELADRWQHSFLVIIIIAHVVCEMRSARAVWKAIITEYQNTDVRESAPACVPRGLTEQYKLGRRAAVLWCIINIAPPPHPVSLSTRCASYRTVVVVVIICLLRSPHQ